MDVIFVDGDDSPKPSLDLINDLRINNSKEITNFLKNRKIPLERVAVADRYTGLLYLAEGSEIQSVHDPYTGEHVRLHKGIQTYIGSLELANSGLNLHSIFVNDSFEVCTDTGAVCYLRPANNRAWTTAMLELTFGNKKSP